MNEFTQLIERIKTFRADRGWSAARLAREAGLHPNTLRDMNTDNWSPSGNTVNKLADLMTREGKAA